MKIKSERDFWSGLMFLITGVCFAVGATNYSLGESARPGPGYFPLGLGVLLAILGAIILFKSLVIETEDGDPIGSIAWKPLAIVVASIVVFGLLLPRLGMIVTIPILIFMVSLAGQEFKLKDVIINAIVLTIASWALFDYGLDLTIPVWPTFIGG